MWSSGTAARSRTAHFTVSARVGNSTTSGPASHSTTVSAPIGELYDVHSTRIRAVSRANGESEVKAKGIAGSAREPSGPLRVRQRTPIFRHDLPPDIGGTHLHRPGRRTVALRAAGRRGSEAACLR